MRRYQVEVAGHTHVVDVHQISGRQFRVVVGGQELDVTLSSGEKIAQTVISPEIAPAGNGNGNGKPAAPLSAAKFKPAAPESLKPMVQAPLPPLSQPPEQGAPNAVKAPMPGGVTSVEVKSGDAVKTGQVLLKLEAMKMVNAVKSPRDGVVAEVRVQAGQNVSHGQVLVTFKEA